MIISNGRDRPLNANSGTVPDVSGAMLDYFQPMTFGVVTKTVENFQVVETMAEVTFQGVWQPQSARQISYKPEGQRAWEWVMLHAEPSLVLEPDQVVIYLGRQFRVKAQSDYRLYGYIQYELVNDYTGAGPEAEA